MYLHSNLNPDLTFSLYAFYVSFFTFPEFVVVEFQTEKCNALLILKWHQKTLELSITRKTLSLAIFANFSLLCTLGH